MPLSTPPVTAQRRRENGGERKEGSADWLTSGEARSGWGFGQRWRTTVGNGEATSPWGIWGHEQLGGRAPTSSGREQLGVRAARSEGSEVGEGWACEST
jgi:hypothetical protein